ALPCCAPHRFRHRARPDAAFPSPPTGPRALLGNGRAHRALHRRCRPGRHCGPAPQTFSSTADVTWGTPPDPVRPRFAQEVDAIAEAGGRLFLAGGFTNLADPSGTAAEPPQPYLAVLDPDTGAPVAGSTFNATAHPDGPVYALALSADGRRLYVGGAFNHIGGKAIPKLAALDVDT